MPPQSLSLSPHPSLHTFTPTCTYRYRQSPDELTMVHSQSTDTRWTDGSTLLLPGLPTVHPLPQRTPSKEELRGRGRVKELRFEGGKGLRESVQGWRRVR